MPGGKKRNRTHGSNNHDNGRNNHDKYRYVALDCEFVGVGKNNWSALGMSLIT